MKKDWKTIIYANKLIFIIVKPLMPHVSNKKVSRK
jgi:hypothetical protein